MGATGYLALRDLWGHPVDPGYLEYQVRTDWTGWMACRAWRDPQGHPVKEGLEEKRGFLDAEGTQGHEAARANGVNGVSMEYEAIRAQPAHKDLAVREAIPVCRVQQDHKVCRGQQVCKVCREQQDNKVCREQ